MFFYHLAGFRIIILAFLDLNAELDGTIDLQAGLTGTLDSGKIQIFEVGIPGLDFPG